MPIFNGDDHPHLKVVMDELMGIHYNSMDEQTDCWCCPEDYNYQNCETCDYRLWKEFINE